MCTSRIFEKEKMRKMLLKQQRTKGNGDLCSLWGWEVTCIGTAARTDSFSPMCMKRRNHVLEIQRLTNEIADVATIAEATGRLAEEGFTIGWEIGVSRERQIVVVASIHQRVPEHEVRRYYALRRRRRPRQVTIAIALRLLNTLQFSAFRPGRIHHHGYKGEGNNNIRANHNTKSTHSWACPHASEHATDCWSCS